MESQARFLDDTDEPMYGFELMRETNFPSGKVYPILARLSAAGRLIRELEEVDPSEAGRPARRHHRLSPDGLAAARSAVAEVAEQVAPRRGTGIIPRPVGGLA